MGGGGGRAEWWCIWTLAGWCHGKGDGIWGVGNGNGELDKKGGNGEMGRWNNVRLIEGRGKERGMGILHTNLD